MTWVLVSGLLVFAFVSSITPGPNNMMLMASGANFGLKRTVPHALGVSLGFGLMVLLVGWGLAGIILTAPWIYEIMRWAGALYLVYLAFKLATAHGIGTGKTSSQPMTFMQAVAFQWVNPKAWAMALGGVATYAAHDHLFWNITLVALIFMLVNGPCVTTWAVFGVGMKRVLTKPWAMRTFNITMALLLLASLYPMIHERMGHV